MRLVMPPGASIHAGIALLQRLLADLRVADRLPLFAGFLVGYLMYDYMHYYLHHFVPKSARGKRLREQHMRHHFQDHRYGYNVYPRSGTWFSARSHVSAATEKFLRFRSYCPTVRTHTKASRNGWDSNAVQVTDEGIQMTPETANGAVAEAAELLRARLRGPRRRAREDERALASLTDGREGKRGPGRPRGSATRTAGRRRRRRRGGTRAGMP